MRTRHRNPPSTRLSRRAPWTHVTASNRGRMPAAMNQYLTFFEIAAWCRLSYCEFALKINQSKETMRRTFREPTQLRRAVARHKCFCPNASAQGELLSNTVIKSACAEMLARKCLHGGACAKVLAQRRLDGGACTEVPAWGCLHGGACTEILARRCLHGGACTVVPARRCRHGGARP